MKIKDLGNCLHLLRYLITIGSVCFLSNEQRGANQVEDYEKSGKYLMFSSMEQEYAIYIDTGIFETRGEFPPVPLPRRRCNSL